MTQKQWLACTDPKMLTFLRGKASDRKLRLFAAACCRRIWPSLRDRGSRKAVEMAERFADGMATEEELGAAEGDAWAAAGGEASGPKREAAAWAASDTEAAAWNAPEAAASAARDPVGEWAAQCDLLRDIFRPFRPATIAPAWRTPQVVALAQAAYDERELPAGTLDLARLAVLADALEEAGGTEQTVLGHLRGPGPHVRGCWVLDLLLGKS